MEMEGNKGKGAGKYANYSPYTWFFRNVWQWSISLPAVDIITEVHLKLNSQKSLQGVSVKYMFINLKVLMIQFMLLAKIHLSTYSHWSVASKLI